jgi:hypothetical protein
MQCLPRLEGSGHLRPKQGRWFRIGKRNRVFPLRLFRVAVCTLKEHVPGDETGGVAPVIEALEDCPWIAVDAFLAVLPTHGQDWNTYEWGIPGGEHAYASALCYAIEWFSRVCAHSGNRSGVFGEGIGLSARVVDRPPGASAHTDAMWNSLSQVNSRHQIQISTRFEN